MGYTQKLGLLAQSVFQDSSLNVGIGAAPSGTYKFEVTGTAKVSGILTLGSTISNGTYTYTLPSATGTLALTSALGDYLPLAGGTLTGALGGTSASFSSTATATAFIPSGATIPTNGMYLSAANTLDFATNTTNRLSINSAGNVGIGVTPNTWYSSNSSKALQIGVAGVGIWGYGSTTNINTYLLNNAYYDSVGFKYAQASGKASYYQQNNGVHTWATTDTVGTAAGDVLSLTPRMTITSAGLVGIATTSPTSPLSLYYPSTSADVNYIKMEMPSWGGSTNYKKNIIWHDGGQIVGGIGMSYASNQTYMDFHSFYNTAATTSTIMRIQGNGLIGIGTTAPSYTLSFNGDVATTIGMNQNTTGAAVSLTLKGADGPNGTNNEGGPIYISSGIGTGNGSTSNIIFSTAPSVGSGTTRQTLTERMRIRYDGNVLIGTSTFTGVGSTALQVSGISTSAQILLTNTTPGHIAFYTTGVDAYITKNTASGNMYFGLAPQNGATFTQQMKIASDGITTINNKLILGTSTFVGEIQYGTSGYGTSDYNAGNGKFSWQSSAGAVAGTIYYSFNADGFGARMTLTNNGNLYAAGTISAGGTKSFLIPHPLTNLKETHNLRHTSVESPQADLIYRGKLTLVNGKAQANIDEISTMTEGTFEALCREVQCFTTNESGWDLVKGKVIGNVIYIESQNANSTDEISWMVIGERKDDYMYEGDITDENGKVIVEPLKPIEPSKPTESINQD